MPALYVVATPIGNLEDITLRAIRILKQVKLIAAEDTRKTRKLLSHYDIHTAITSYHEHNKLTKLDYILDFLKNDDLALVSDAGMPGISDPGYELIAAVSHNKIQVVPIPGPSVLVSALVISGLPTSGFHYTGFLPRQAGERRRFLLSLNNEADTLVLFESPHRISASLKDMLDVLGNRQIAICRELTKLHEEVFRGTISQAVEHFVAPRGEFTLVIAGKTKDSKPEIQTNIHERLRSLCLAGSTAKEAVKQVFEETGVSRKELYQAWLNIK